MRSRSYHQEIVKVLEGRSRRRGGIHGNVPRYTDAQPLTLKARVGVWVWIVLLGASASYELLAFGDGPDGQPTLSQLVKGLVRTGGRMGVIACILTLFGAAIVLTLHLALQLF